MATSILNLSACANNTGNTGSPDCVFDPTVIKGGILAPKNAEIPASALVSQDALQTFLAGKFLAPKGTRWYPLPAGEAFTDNSADVTIQQLSGGASIPVKDGDYDFTQQYLDGKLCVSNQLRKFRGNSYRYFAITSDGTIMGTQNKTKDGIAPAPLIYFYPYPQKLASDSEVASYRYRVAMKPEYLNERIAWVKTDFDVLGMSGLINVILKYVSRLTGTPAVQTISVKTCAGGNLSDTYPTEILMAGVFLVTNASTGAAVTVTARSLDANGNVVLTLDSTDTDYNATAGGMLIQMADAATLNTTFGIAGYESNILPSIVPA